MEATNKNPLNEPQYDLDRIRALALAAGVRIRENAHLRQRGEPMKDTAPLQEYAKAIAPNVALVMLHRLAQATELLEAVKGGVADLPLRKRLDAFLTGVMTQEDFLRALPHYVADLSGAAPDAAGVH